MIDEVTRVPDFKCTCKEHEEGDTYQEVCSLCQGTGRVWAMIYPATHESPEEHSYSPCTCTYTTWKQCGICGGFLDRTHINAT